LLSISVTPSRAPPVIAERLDEPRLIEAHLQSFGSPARERREPPARELGRAPEIEAADPVRHHVERLSARADALARVVHRPHRVDLAFEIEGPTREILSPELVDAGRVVAPQRRVREARDAPHPGRVIDGDLGEERHSLALRARVVDPRQAHHLDRAELRAFVAARTARDPGLGEVERGGDVAERVGRARGRKIERRGPSSLATELEVARDLAR
jgi:hypothetical protein